MKDEISAWFMRNVIKPRMERIDQPGYVTSSVGEISNLRELFIPEQLLVEIEDRVTDEYGEEGARKLYEAGKRFGWRYSDVSEFPKTESASNMKLKEFFEFFIRYIEATFSSSIDYDIDIDQKEYRMEAEDWVVCRKNGKGYVLTEGAPAGVMSYLFSDPEIDAVHRQCQGKGVEHCEIECSTSVGKSGFRPETEIAAAKKYRQLNEVVEVETAEKSMQDLLDSGFFDYTGGKLTFEGERYVLPAADLIYVLEHELSGLDGVEETLFESGCTVGERIGEGKELSFVTDYLSALGWGGIRILEGGDEIQVSHFPWTALAEEVDMHIFRGMVSGLVSASTGSKVRYRDFKAEKSKDGYRLKLSGDGR